MMSISGKFSLLSGLGNDPADKGLKKDCLGNSAQKSTNEGSMILPVFVVIIYRICQHIDAGVIILSLSVITLSCAGAVTFSAGAEKYCASK
jgi:hypothetical protein